MSIRKIRAIINGEVLSLLFMPHWPAHLPSGLLILAYQGGVVCAANTLSLIYAVEPDVWNRMSGMIAFLPRGRPHHISYSQSTFILMVSASYIYDRASALAEVLNTLTPFKRWLFQCFNV